jgi:hypothetical protein
MITCNESAKHPTLREPVAPLVAQRTAVASFLIDSMVLAHFSGETLLQACPPSALSMCLIRNTPLLTRSTTYSAQKLRISS